jgi:hypothetical protein
MDLNYLFHRQQVERMRAAGAAVPAVEKAHAEMARRYEQVIDEETDGDFQFGDAAPEEKDS